jgi:NAD(P)H-dependent FMN reductase
MRILAISGSLRARSSNTALVHAAALVAPPDATLIIYRALGSLPHFNPDLDTDGSDPPPSVADFRAALRAADAILLSSPEYAHGVPGTLKNALDWIVGSGELIGKPIALVNTSTRSEFVTTQLVETLTVMMGEVVIATALPVDGRSLDAAAIAADEELAAVLQSVLEQLIEAAGPRAETPKRP